LSLPWVSRYDDRGNVDPTFGPFDDQTVISGLPAFTWIVNFDGARGDTLVITATENVFTKNGFEDRFTFTSPGWIVFSATLVRSNFSGIDGPAATVTFDGGSVTNFGGGTRGSRFTAVIHLVTCRRRTGGADGAATRSGTPQAQRQTEVESIRFTARAIPTASPLAHKLSNCSLSLPFRPPALNGAPSLSAVLTYWCLHSGFDINTVKAYPVLEKALNDSVVPHFRRGVCRRGDGTGRFAELIYCPGQSGSLGLEIE
jgi:hypothetical protein